MGQTIEGFCGGLDLEDWTRRFLQRLSQGGVGSWHTVELQPGGVGQMIIGGSGKWLDSEIR